VSFLGSVGGVGRVSTALLRHKLIAVTGGTAALAGRALARDLDPLPVTDPGRDAGLDGP